MSLTEPVETTVYCSGCNRLRAELADAATLRHAEIDRLRAELAKLGESHKAVQRCLSAADAGNTKLEADHAKLRALCKEAGVYALAGEHAAGCNCLGCRLRAAGRGEGER